MSPAPAAQAKRTLIVVMVALPLLAVAAVLAFAWPAARVAPRDLPVGIVGTTPATQAAVAGIDHAKPGAFDLRVYADVDAARSAIEHRDVFGSFVVTPQRVTALVASAASPTVSQLLDTAGGQLADGADLPLTSVDVVPLSPDDPHGSVLTSTVLPLALGSIITAAAIAALVRVRPAWRQFGVLVAASVKVGTGVYLIAQGFLGALPGDHFQTWGAMVLTVLAISCTVAGIYAIIGTPGIGLGSAVIVFVGNAFSGSSSAPELLPGAVRDIGRALPPGAGASLLRTTAFFHGNSGGPYLAVLIGWIVFGALGMYLGHHPSGRFTIRRTPKDVVEQRRSDAALPDRELIEAPQLIMANGHSVNGHHEDGRYAGAHEAR